MKQDHYLTVTHGAYTKVVPNSRATKGFCPRCGQEVPVLNGAFFRRKRHNAGVSLRALSARLKLSPAYVSDMELGKRTFLPKYVHAYEKLNGRADPGHRG